MGSLIEEKDIERNNRVGGGKDDDGKSPRAIAMEVISERLKHLDAAETLRRSCQTKAGFLIFAIWFY